MHFWNRFRGLPLLERRHVATFHSPEFACMLGKLYEKWQTTAEPFKYKFSMLSDKFYAVSERSYHNYRNKEKVLSYTNVVTPWAGSLSKQKSAVRSSHPLWRAVERAWVAVWPSRGATRWCQRVFGRLWSDRNRKKTGLVLYLGLKRTKTSWSLGRDTHHETDSPVL